MDTVPFWHKRIIPQPIYGVWIPSKGWVRGADGKAFGDTNKKIAQQLADRLGNGAVVYYIDECLDDLEKLLLETEKENVIR